MVANIVASIILIAVVGGAITYIVRSKKKGVKCIGCSCSGGCGESCSCDSDKENV